MLNIQIFSEKKKKVYDHDDREFGKVVIPGLASTIKLHHIFDCTQRTYTSLRTQPQWKASNLSNNGP